VGFLPRSGVERRRAMEIIRDTPETVVLFESPQRLAATLSDLADAMPARQAMVARELTKLHEELARGTLHGLAEGAAEREWLGEITVVLGPFEATAPERVMTEEQLFRRIDSELAAGLRAKDIAEAIAFETGMPRREVYTRVITRRR
jgi:16S rRNA (cytidine1402-2'-O)-methyltransferase